MQNIDGNKENTKGRRFPLYLLCLILAVAAAAVKTPSMNLIT